VPEPGAYDEFDLGHFRAGQTYVIPSHLASLLILDGYAELADTNPPRTQVADFGNPRFPRRK